jgi:hypothetical protein
MHSLLDLILDFHPLDLVGRESVSEGPEGAVNVARLRRDMGAGGYTKRLALEVALYLVRIS